MGEAVGGVEDRAMRRADDLLLARIVINGDTLVGAGALAGDEIAVRKANEQAALTIGGIGEGERAIAGHVGMADDGAGMGWLCWCGCRRRLRRLLGWLLRGAGSRRRLRASGR